MNLKHLIIFLLLRNINFVKIISNFIRLLSLILISLTINLLNKYNQYTHLVVVILVLLILLVIFLKTRKMGKLKYFKIAWWVGFFLIMSIGGSADTAFNLQ